MDSIASLGLVDRVVIVTGAGHGLGREFAEVLAHLGAAIVVNDVGRDSEGKWLAEQVAQAVIEAGGRAVANTASVADPAGAREIVETGVKAFGRVDALINNAGIVSSAAFENVTLDELRAILDVHLLGTFLVSQHAFRVMKDAGYGRIVNVSSNAGCFGMANVSAYAAAKAGVIGLTYSMAIEGREHGILVNAIAPMANTNPGRTRGNVEVFRKIGPRSHVGFVAPLVAYLVSPSCVETHSIFSAVAGRYARIFLGVTEGWVSSKEKPPSPEEIEEHMSEILTTSQYEVPGSMQEEGEIVARQLGRLSVE